MFGHLIACQGSSIYYLKKKTLPFSSSLFSYIIIYILSLWILYFNFKYFK